VGEPEDEGAADPARDLEEDARDVGRAAHRVLERWPAARWGARPPPDELQARLVAEGIDAESPDLAQLAEGIACWLEGPYVRAVRAASATLLREEPFVLEVEGPVALALRGAMDLVVHASNGRVDVIDYKRSRPRSDLSAYAFQLRAYALALRRRFPDHRVRAGVLFLGADQPRWLTGAAGQPEFSNEDHLTFEMELSRLASLVRRLPRRRRVGRRPPRALPQARLRLRDRVPPHPRKRPMRRSPRPPLAGAAGEPWMPSRSCDAHPRAALRAPRPSQGSCSLSPFAARAPGGATPRSASTLHLPWARSGAPSLNAPPP
jgi:hypothetical protein